MGKICSGINNENFMSCTTAQIFFIFFHCLQQLDQRQSIFVLFVMNILKDFGLLLILDRLKRMLSLSETSG